MMVAPFLESWAWVVIALVVREIPLLLVVIAALALAIVRFRTAPLSASIAIGTMFLLASGCLLDAAATCAGAWLSLSTAPPPVTTFAGISFNDAILVVLIASPILRGLLGVLAVVLLVVAVFLGRPREFADDVTP